MSDYQSARQALRHQCREVLGLSQPQTDTMVCVLENFLEAFAEQKLASLEASMAAAPLQPPPSGGK